VTRSYRFAPLLLLALSLSAGAAAPHTPTKPFARQEADQLDYLFLASDRPVLIRLHLRAGDKPYPAVWEAFMDKLFVWFDKDNDGSLSPAEVARLMPAQTLSFSLQGAIGAGGNQTAPFASLDTNKDGKVSKEEFRAYYRSGGISPLRFSVNNAQAQTAKQVNDSLYRRLGRSGKGKLTKADVVKLPGLLDRLDENEDEMLTSTELNLDGEGENIYADFAFGGGPQGPQPTDSGLSEIQPGMTATSLAALVMKKYDANKDGKLTLGEGGLDKDFFKSLDANKDGTLDAREVEAFFYRQPDVVLKGRVGAIDTGFMGLVARTGLFGKSQRTEVVNQAKLAAPLAKKVRKVDADNLYLELGDARVSVQATEGTSASRLQGVKQFYLQQFDAIANKDGFVERGKDNDGNRFITNLFTQADKNADGKLHRKEFVEWLDLMESGGSAFVSVTVNDTGRSLFNLLDVNGDGKLSIREMRSAWVRMEPLCKAGEGMAQTDLPRTLQVTMGQGFTSGRSQFAFFGIGTPVVPKSVNRNVPAWFTKMDRNADGDVSLKEWLGSEESFKEIDTDGDGLISADEARAFEAKKKKDSSKK
jgi:hypothetical protein